MTERKGKGQKHVLLETASKDSEKKHDEKQMKASKSVQRAMAGKGNRSRNCTVEGE